MKQPTFKEWYAENGHKYRTPISHAMTVEGLAIEAIDDFTRAFIDYVDEMRALELEALAKLVGG